MNFILNLSWPPHSSKALKSQPLRHTCVHVNTYTWIQTHICWRIIWINKLLFGVQKQLYSIVVSFSIVDLEVERKKKNRGKTKKNKALYQHRSNFCSPVSILPSPSLPLLQEPIMLHLDNPGNWVENTLQSWRGGRQGITESWGRKGVGGGWKVAEWWRTGRCEVVLFLGDGMIQWRSHGNLWSNV